MRASLAFWVACRNIASKQHNRFISFVALIATGGLILGVAALITVLSVMNGFEQQMKDKLLGLIPHIQLSSPSLITDWHDIQQQLKDSDSNIATVMPVLNTQAMLIAAPSPKRRLNHTQMLMLNGISHTNDSNFILLNQSGDQGMIAGRLDSLNEQAPNLIIGKTLADELGVAVGDDVHIALPKAVSPSHANADNSLNSESPSNGNVELITPVTQRFTVTGIFKLTPQTERYIALTNIHSIANILGVPVGVQGFRIQLHDVFNAPATSAKLTAQHPTFHAQHWIHTHGSVYESLQMQRTISGLLLFLIVLVAGFNLVSSLVMTVTDKKADIAILKTMGASSATIYAVFFWQGFIISVLGVGIGTALGVGLSLSIGSLSDWVNRRFELGLFDSYFVTQLPSVIYLSDIALVVGASLLVGVISAWYPAYRATKIAPASALRYD